MKVDNLLSKCDKHAQAVGYPCIIGRDSLRNENHTFSADRVLTTDFKQGFQSFNFSIFPSQKGGRNHVAAPPF